MSEKEAVVVNEDDVIVEGIDKFQLDDPNNVIVGMVGMMEEEELTRSNHNLVVMTNDEAMIEEELVVKNVGSFITQGEAIDDEKEEQIRQWLQEQKDIRSKARHIELDHRLAKEQKEKLRKEQIERAERKEEERLKAASKKKVKGGKTSKTK